LTVADTTYANGLAISCKSSGNKVIAGFPDVCLSPPSPPAGPLPLPYPVSSNASDMTSGSTTVKISGDEIMLKDKSYYKKCTGDEAATKSLGQGAVNHALSGKVYFVAWSMDVLVEGENVVRHLDMTTSNHASPMANESVPFPGIEKAWLAPGCTATYQKYGLSAYGKNKCPTGDNSHHPAMNACFQSPRYTSIPTCKNYDCDGAPGICLETKNPAKGKETPHKQVNAAQDEWGREWKRGLSLDSTDPDHKSGPPKRSDVRKAGKEQLQDPGGLSEAEAECVMLVVDKYLDSVGITESTVLRTPYT
jgi:uncharacterized protein DUF4150